MLWRRTGGCSIISKFKFMKILLWCTCCRSRTFCSICIVTAVIGSLCSCHLTCTLKWNKYTIVVFGWFTWERDILGYMRGGVDRNSTVLRKTRKQVSISNFAKLVTNRESQKVIWGSQNHGCGALPCKLMSVWKCMYRNNGWPEGEGDEVLLMIVQFQKIDQKEFFEYFKYFLIFQYHLKFLYLDFHLMIFEISYHKSFNWVLTSVITP